MKLHGRNLNRGMKGIDVGLLHTELRELGFFPDKTEWEESLFGPRTEEIVKDFQGSHGLPVTGVVDQTTATFINSESHDHAAILGGVDMKVTDLLSTMSSIDAKLGNLVTALNGIQADLGRLIDALRRI